MPDRRIHRLTRRTFLRDLGGGTFAIAILGAAGACGDHDAGTAPPGTSMTTTAPAPTATGEAEGTTGEPAPSPLAWERVALGFVSAYVLARGNDVAVVDTGTAGSEAQILAGLGALGLGWSDVRHLVLTHRHPDHQGSAPAVMGAAPSATAYAGRDDVEAIEGIDLTALDDGDDVFGLQVVATPGHTPGHISVFDPDARFLVAGDALNGAEGGGVAGPNEDFDADHDQALDQIARLAALDPEVVVFGHGDPVLDGAASQIAALA